MEDDALLRTAKSPAPRQSRPTEHLWSLFKSGRRLDCDLRFHGESYGWEYRCVEDSGLGYGQQFVLKAAALEEAEAERRRLMRGGWTSE